MSDKFALIKDKQAKDIIDLHKDFFESENISISTDISAAEVKDILNSPKFKKYKEEKEANKEEAGKNTAKEEAVEENSEPKSEKKEDKPNADNVFSVGQMSDDDADKVGKTDAEHKNTFWNEWAKENKKTIEESQTEEGHFFAKFFDEKGEKHEASIIESKNNETGRKSIDIIRNEEDELPKDEYFDAVVKRVMDVTEKNNKKNNKKQKPLVLIKADVSPEFKEKLIKACKENNVGFKDLEPKEKGKEAEKEKVAEKENGAFEVDQKIEKVKNKGKKPKKEEKKEEDKEEEQAPQTPQASVGRDR